MQNTAFKHKALSKWEFFGIRKKVQATVNENSADVGSMNYLEMKDINQILPAL